MTELNPLFLEYDAMDWTVKFLEYDAKNWTVCSNKTKRIGPFFKYYSKKWFFSQYDSHRIELLKKILKELNSFFWYDSKNWTPSSDKTRRIELFCWIRLNKVNPFVTDSKNWIFFNVIQRVFFAKMTLSILRFFLNMTQELNFFWKTMTHRKEKFFSILLKELNPFQHMTRRIEHFFNRTFSIWLKGWIFYNMIWRVQPTFFFDLQIWLFWRNESNIWTLCEHDSKNLTFFHLIHIIEPYFSIDSQNDFFEITFRIEFFFFWQNSERIERIEPFLDITQKIELFFWKYDSKNFFLLNLTERIVPSFFHDSNTWTFFTWLT